MSLIQNPSGSTQNPVNAIGSFPVVPVVPLQVVSVAAATTLTPAQNGAIVSISQAAAYAVTLPSATTYPGLLYHLKVATSAANAQTFTDGANAVKCTELNTPAGVLLASSSGNTLTLSASAVVGSYCTLYSNGTNWFADCVSAAAGTKWAAA